MKIVKLNILALFLILTGSSCSRDDKETCSELLKEYLTKYSGINSKDPKAYYILLYDGSEKIDLNRLLSTFDPKLDRIEMTDVDSWSDFYTFRVISLSGKFNSILEVIYTKEDERQKIRIASIDFYKRK